MTCLYASNPVYWRSLGTSTREPTPRSLEVGKALLEPVLAKASAMATSLTPESAVRACSAAPVPRPPQPTRPTLIVLLPAAWTRGTVKPVETPSRGRASPQSLSPS